VVLLAAAVLLVAAVFASVHHAEILAHRLGEPFGSIVLAVAVTVIEVALIVSIMLAAKEGSDVLARDTVFATVMIVLNGIVGLCLMLGSLRHYEHDPVAEKMMKLAKASKVPIVGAAETEPPGKTYQGWTMSEVDAVDKALPRLTQ
jgi:Ca2+/H+ antiporter